MAGEVQLLGLDLGQLQDYTALVVLQKSGAAEPPYVIRALHRFPIGMPYPTMVQQIRNWTAQAPLAGGAMAVDATGVGQAVVDMFRASVLSVALYPILITGGHETIPDEKQGGWHVPKKELVSVLQVLLGSRRLVLATPNLPHGKILEKELRTFSSKITTAGNETFESWRERDHDDLVLGVALGAWLGECTAAGWDGTIRSDRSRDGRGDSLVARMPGGVFDSPGGPANDSTFFGGRAPDSGQGLSFPAW